MTQSITQRHDMACGLACVSFLTSIPYDVLTGTVKAEQLNSRGFYCPELVKLLKDGGLNYAWKKLSEEERDGNFTEGSIVFVERSTLLRHGHFLAKSAEGWMDPWINLSTDSNLSTAQSGFRSDLPGRAEYLIYPL